MQIVERITIILRSSGGAVKRNFRAAGAASALVAWPLVPDQQDTGPEPVGDRFVRLRALCGIGSDLYDVHNYSMPASLRKTFASLKTGTGQRLLETIRKTFLMRVTSRISSVSSVASGGTREAKGRTGATGPTQDRKGICGSLYQNPAGGFWIIPKSADVLYAVDRCRTGSKWPVLL